MSQQLAVGLSLGLGVAAAVVVLRQRRGLYAAQQLRPPVLEKRPHMVPFGAVPGQNRGETPMEPVLYIEDPYFYVRDDTRSDPLVLEHLKQENAYTEAKTAHLASARATLYDELLSHVQETDQEVPYRHGPYFYYTRTQEGSSYAFHCRVAASGDAPTSEELLLDENAIAQGHEHCDIISVCVSRDHRFLAYLVDVTGSETYTGYIKDLTTDTLLPDRLVDISDLQWGGDDAAEIFYATQDETLRQHKIWRYKVGANEPAACLYTEDDELFSVELAGTRSGRYIKCTSLSSETTETWLVDLTDRERTLQLVAKREHGIKYSLDHREDHLYIVTNRDNATNFKLMRTPVTALGPAHWRDVFPYDEAIKIDYVDCFKHFFVVHGREDGFSQLWIGTDTDGGHSKYRLALDEPSYDVWGAVNLEYDPTIYRVAYTSLTTPRTLFDLDISTGHRVVCKETPCPNYDRSLYTSERMEATAPDGTTVPISLVYRTELRRPVGTPQPLHLYGYGAYEACIEPSFVATRLPLLDRGVIYAIAHVRGGGEKGRTWYEQAKYEHKTTSFTDFIACAEHLVCIGLTSPARLSCEGRSAGGTLIGAVLNLRPDLFRVAIAGVPFVDVMNTMSDAAVPLTTGEWEELGNPNERAAFAYMLQYSPYENVTEQRYPSLLVTSGLHDPRVAYWEPTKWVARLRERARGDAAVLLRTNLTAGHFGGSDRYQFLRDTAFEWAFLLDQLQCL